MLEKIEHKIDSIIETILAKDPRHVTYSEYKILDCRAKDIRFLAEQKQKSEEMTQMMIKTLGCGFGIGTTPLPEPNIKEE